MIRPAYVTGFFLVVVECGGGVCCGIFWLVCFVSSFKCNMIIQVGKNLGRSLVQPSAQSWVSAAF